MNSQWKALKTEEEYDIALARTIELFHAEKGTPESDELETLLPLIIEYEDQHFHIPSPDPNNEMK